MKNKTVSSILKIILISVLVLIFALAAWWLWFRPSEKNPPAQVSVARVKSGNLTLTASGEGVLEQTTLPVGFSIPGILVEIAKPGQSVTAGELLAAVDSKKAKLDVQKSELSWQTISSPYQVAALKFEEMQAQNDLVDAQNRFNEIVLGPDIEYYKSLLAYAERDYWEAYKNLARARARAEKNKKAAASLHRLNIKFTAAELALEEAKLDLEWALNYKSNPSEALLVEGKLQAAQSILTTKTNSISAFQEKESDLLFYSNSSSTGILPLQNAWADLEQAQLVLAASSLTAPFDGTVTQVNFQTGEELSAFQPVLTLVADAPFTVKFSLDEKDLQLLSIGDAFTATPTAYPNLELVGVITKIAPVIAENALITVWGQILPNDLVVKLMPGMNIDVTVTLAESTDTLIVPLQAIQHDSNGQTFVNLVQVNGSFKPIPVTLGLSDVANVEVKGDLKTGDAISTVIGTR
ncbi:MAG: efflux RND transporter periplasmic adaptor subunit [Chloroflexota bacterium]